MIITKADAATEDYRKHLNGENIATSAVIYLVDGRYPVMQNNPTSWMQNRFKHGKVMNVIRLSYSQDEIAKLSACTLTVDFSLDLTDALGGVTTHTGSLSVEYDPAAGTSFKSEDLLVFNGGHIANLTVTNVSTGLVTIPDAFKLENQVLVERYYHFDHTEVPEVYKSVIDQELELSWEMIEGAAYYEVEWAFVDNYNGSGGSVSMNSLPYNLRYDASNIRTKQSFVRIPIIYDEGYIVYRVRAVAKFVDDDGSLNVPDEMPWKNGAWSLSDYAGMIVDAYPESVYEITTPMVDDDLNWATYNSFGDDGIFSSSVVYYDGTMRNRQNLVKNREVDKALLTETFYDHYGRPAVKSLVAPTESNSMDYYDNFNRNPFGTSPYSKEDFDKDDPLNDCFIDLEGMHTGYGASKYYSYTNTNDDGSQGFVPQAEKFPFTQIEYTRDHTGRVQKVTMPGDVHNLVNGHEKLIEYTTPSQVLLNHLFGTNVGWNDNYSRVSITDENGQMMAKYIDGKGQVIATSVVGEAPPTLMNLDNEVNATGSAVVVETILEEGNNFWEFTSQFYIDISGDQDFRYAMTPESFSLACMEDLCYDCHYVLNIHIEDFCGVEWFDTDYSIGPTTIDDVCESTIAEFEAFIDDLYLEKGPYTVTKTLTVDNSNLEYYTESYLKSGCITPFDDFLSDEFAEGFDLDCGNTPCENSCVDQLGTLEAWLGGGGTTEQYYILFQECILACAETDPCDDLLQVLLADVTPGGQYALFDDNGTWDPSVFPLSVLNTSNQLGLNEHWRNPTTPYVDAQGNPSYININGTLYLPEDPAVSVDLFIVNFANNPSWAYSLVEYHPEYCLYDICIQHNLSGSNTWDYYFNLETKYVDANSVGYFNPLNAGTSQGVPSAIGVNTSNKDPFFFDANSPGLSYYGQAINTMQNFVTVGLSTYTMWDMALVYAYCPEATTEIQINTCLANSPDYNSPGCSEDLVWLMFQELYQGMKQEMIREIAINYSIENYCYNGCIGSRYFDYDPNEFNFKNSPYYTTEQPCHGTTEHLYADKIPRYPIFMEEATVSIEDQCEDECLEKMLYWDEALSSCSLGLLTTPILNEIFELCTLGCDISNLGGASTLPSGSQTGNGNTSIDEVMAFHLGSSYKSELCSPWLISDPMPYGHTESVSQSKLDECGCDRILQNEYDFLNLSSSIPLVVDGQDYFQHQYGISLPMYDQYVCDCNDIYFQEYSANWAPSATWNAATVAALEALDRETFINIGCNTCLDCDLLTDAVNDVTTLHSYSTNFTYFDLVLRNYINSEYLTNFSIAQINTMLERCDMASTAGGTYCTDPYEHVGELEETINELVENDDLLNLSTSPSNLISLTNFWGSYLFDYTVGHFFWADNSTTSTSMSGDFNIGMIIDDEPISECQMHLDIQGTSLPSYVNMGGLVEVSNLAPLSTSVNGMNHDFTMDADFSDGTSTYSTTIDGYTTCYPIKTCYIESELALCTPEIQKLDQDIIDDCILEQYALAEFNAWNDYQDHLEYQTDLFAGLYTQQCSLAVETEELTWDHQLYEYHFTLFYFDQVGNLVKTVPPNGIDHTTILITTAASDAVDVARETGATLIPAHTMETKYRYNTRNQVVESVSPDVGKMKYWYDDAGKLIYTQNAKQAASSTPKYNYTWRDEHDRIVEYGVVSSFTNPDGYTSGRCDVETFITSGGRNEITRIVYNASSGFPTTQPVLTQRNLQDRIAMVAVYQNYATIDNYDNAYHYSYDEQGNIEFVVFHNKELDTYNNGAYKPGVKYTQYEFDHSTGNLLAVNFQGEEYGGSSDKRHPDAYYTRFFYDNNNRLASIETSQDELVWKQDVKYYYYDHGPLARVELGDKKVYGEDHYYTIHNWVKGVNSNSLSATRDPGNDGTLGFLGDFNKIHKTVAEDAYAFSLAYYDDDYSEIEPLSTANHPIADFASSALDAGSYQLFNGAMRHKVTSIDGLLSQGTAYKYDQLSRLKAMNAYQNLDLGTNTWGSTSTLTDFASTYTFDPNGNILGLNRNGNATIGTDMDILTFTLTAGSDRLDYVSDGGTNYSGYDDIKSGQATGNYTYNSIGQLIGDVQANISDISYTASGKVKQITLGTGTVNYVKFDYDAFGNRVRKLIEDPVTADKSYTYYMHGASGDLMSMYESNYDEDGLISGDFTYDMTLSHVPIVGYKRHGTHARNKPVYSKAVVGGTPTVINHEESVTASAFYSGDKYFELTDHLGNVQATVSDVKLFNEVSELHNVSFTGGTTEGWAADPSGSWVTVDNTNFRLVVVPPNQNDGAVKTISTVAGETYWFEMDLNINTAVDVGFKAYPNGGSTDLGSGSTTASGSVGFYFTATSASTDIKVFRNSSTAGTYYLNSVQVHNTSFVADVTSHSDYYPFGMAMPGRTSNSQAYKYGHNGMEQDDEVKGYDNAYSTYFRHYDPRLARWYSTDPVVQPWQSTYVAFDNNPIYYADPMGDAAICLSAGAFNFVNAVGAAAVPLGLDVVAQSVNQSVEVMQDVSDNDDILIRGTDGKEVYIQTSEVKITVIEVPFELGENKKYDYRDASLEDFAVGYQITGTFTGQAFIGSSHSVLGHNVMFLNSEYGGYWYTFVGGESVLRAGPGFEATISANKSLFIAYTPTGARTPGSFAGKYKTVGASVDLLGGVERALTADMVQINGFAQYSWTNDWRIIEFGAGVGVGPGLNLVSVFGGGGMTTLITPEIPTSQRLWYDIIMNNVLFNPISPFSPF
ncbi:MAG: RHS repeat-associated core domain-containing protein [Cryomorphaceae bacterium]